MALDSHAVGPDTIDALTQRIAALVGERQALRDAGAEPVVLEQNRVEIARAQQELSAALIVRHLPAAA